MLALALGLTALTDRSRADGLDLTLHVPSGYATEQRGKVRFTYPARTRDEARALMATHAAAWTRVARELGATIDSELDIRIATNPEQMQGLAPKGVPLPGYADGVALPAQGLILLTLTSPDTWLRPDMRTVLTHELSHVALHRATHGAPIPRWFSEGVAIHQAAERSFERTRTLWEGTLQGRLLPLEQLTQFPAQHHAVDLAYAQSADFVDQMLAGADQRARFRVLLAELRKGVAFPDAVRSAYHVPLGYMEREWRNSVTQRFGRWPALLMGLTFVWAVGAVLLLVGYLRARRKHKRTLKRWALEEAPARASVPPPPPQAVATHAAAAAQPPASQATAAHSPIDDFFENRRQPSDKGVPTVVHDGQSHTLH
jgi:hypothetical protein